VSIDSDRLVKKYTHDKTVLGAAKDVKEFNYRKALELLPDKTLIGMVNDIQEILRTRRGRPYVTWRGGPDKTWKGVIADVKDLTRKDVLIQLPDKALRGILKDIKELLTGRV